MNNLDYKKKYLKYKNKYLNLKGGKKYNSIQAYKKQNKKYGKKCIIARVLRGKTDDDFNKLANNRKLVFLTPDGTKLLNLEKTEQMLDKIGYPPEFIKDLQKEKTYFKLALLDECKNSKDYKLATWNNLLKLFLYQYPKIAEKLKTIYNWEVQLKKMKTTHSKIEYDQLMKDFSVQNLRDFMNNIENINEFYTGRGYIINKKNEITGSEFITKNTKKKWEGDNYPHLINLPKISKSGN